MSVERDRLLVVLELIFFSRSRHQLNRLRHTRLIV